MTVSTVLISALNGPAGVQTGGGNGLNGKATTAILAACTVNCGENFSAVDTSNTLAPSAGLVLGDSSLQVVLTVAQPISPATGFDVQVEAIFTVGVTTGYAFGTAYFDTGTNLAGSFIWVGLYVDLGTASTTMPSLTDVVVTMNGCLAATSCP